MPQEPPCEQDGYGGNLARVAALLQEALNLLDAIDAPPEFGAKLQEIIDGVGARGGDAAPA